MARLMRLPGRVAAAPRRVASPAKVADRFYQSPEWKALVAAVRAERGKRCEAAGCGRTGFVIGDHIVEIRDGGAKLDKANVQLLCARCHGRKTEAARQRRAGLAPGALSDMRPPS